MLICKCAAAFFVPAQVKHTLLFNIIEPLIFLVITLFFDILICGIYKGIDLLFGFIVLHITLVIMPHLFCIAFYLFSGI